MLPGAKENVAHLTTAERRREAEQAALQSDKHISVTNTSVPTRFKDLVEKTAEENGLMFIPIPNRRHEGKTVYSFGKCLGTILFDFPKQCTRLVNVLVRFCLIFLNSVLVW